MLRLTRYREARRLSRAALARAASLDQAFVSKIEKGRVVPYPVQLARLAAALGVPAEQADTLLERVDDAAVGVCR